MIIDKFLQMADAQAVTASAASADVIDCGQSNPDLGAGDQPLSLVVTVDEAATAAGAATLTVALQDSADNASFADVVVSRAVPKAELGAGSQIVVPLPSQHRRYLRTNFVVGTGPLTAGAFSAQIVAGYQQNVPRPDAL